MAGVPFTELSLNNRILKTYMTDKNIEHSKDGFRLYHVQVLNWGTWHKDVSTFKVHGHDALLTGDNGSGKSTLVDAITTLLIPRNKLEFNMASGDKKDSRNLKSYVLGYYKSTADDDYGKKNIGLRDNQSFVTIILCAFYNKPLDEYVTLAQIMYADPNKNNAVTVSHYIVCQRLLDIKNDLSALGTSSRQIGATLKKRNIDYYSDFKTYRHKFMQYLGLQEEQALSLFCQAISLKKVENISSFVRNYMLSYKDPGIDRLIQHYNDLLTVHKRLETARDQEAMLTPLVDDVETYEKYKYDQVLYELCSYNLDPLYASFKQEPLDNVLKDTEHKKQLAQSRIDKLNKKMDKLSQDYSDTQFAIAQNGGSLLSSLEEREKRLHGDISRTQKNLDRYKDSIALVAIKDESIKAAASEKAFIEQKEHLNNLKTQCEIERTTIFNDLHQIISKQEQTQKSLGSLQSEIASLESRSSNISLNQIKMRQSIVQALSLDEEDLPFVGELIEIKAQERAVWEGAIERVLHGFALSLLVRDDLYQTISDYVEKNNLKVKLVYYKVNSKEYEHEIKATEQIYKNSLVNKVKIKPDMGCFTNYVRSEIIKRFNFVCVEDMVKFRLEKKAITPQGQIKFSETRHEKDDRSRIDDRSRFVLGWSNKDKIAYLKKSQLSLKSELADCELLRAQKDNEYKGAHNSISCISRILEIEKFCDIDVKSLKRELDDIIAKIEYQKHHNATLQSLKERLNEIVQEQRQTQSSIQNETISLGGINKNLEQFAELIRINNEDLERPLYLDNDCGIGRDDLKALFDSLIEKNKALHEQKLGSRIFVESVFTGTYNAINRHLSEKERQISESKEELSSQITRVMSQFKAQYPEDTMDLDASIEAAPYFKNYLIKIRNEDLPRHVDNFKRVLHEHTINHITAFSVDLDNHKEEIKKKVALINTSLKSIDYSDNTFIELIAVDSKDQDIKTFREDMRQCTLMAGDDEDDLNKAEARFNTIKAFIDVLINREKHAEADKRYTQKVTDVRNWFNFVVRENSRLDNSEVNLYADTDGKSGGEKVKLAYSILASSLAYQYGTGAQDNRSFRLAVIDEAFAHGSDDGSSEYALRLFNKLNIQLMVVTPNSKISLIENYVQSVGHVIKRANVSTLQNMTIEVFRRLKEQSLIRKKHKEAKFEAMKDELRIKELIPEKASDMDRELDTDLDNKTDLAAPVVLDTDKDTAYNLAVDEDTETSADLDEDFALDEDANDGTDVTVDKERKLQALELVSSDKKLEDLLQGFNSKFDADLKRKKKAQALKLRDSKQQESLDSDKKDIDNSSLYDNTVNNERNYIEGDDDLFKSLQQISQYEQSQKSNSADAKSGAIQDEAESESFIDDISNAIKKIKGEMA